MVQYIKKLLENNKETKNISDLPRLQLNNIFSFLSQGKDLLNLKLTNKNISDALAIITLTLNYRTNDKNIKEYIEQLQDINNSVPGTESHIDIIKVKLIVKNSQEIPNELLEELKKLPKNSDLILELHDLKDISKFAGMHVKELQIAADGSIDYNIELQIFELASLEKLLLKGAYLDWVYKRSDEDKAPYIYTENAANRVSELCTQHNITKKQMIQNTIDGIRKIGLKEISYLFGIGQASSTLFGIELTELMEAGVKRIQTDKVHNDRYKYSFNTIVAQLYSPLAKEIKKYLQEQKNGNIANNANEKIRSIFGIGGTRSKSDQYIIGYDFYKHISSSINNYHMGFLWETAYFDIKNYIKVELLYGEHMLRNQHYVELINPIKETLEELLKTEGFEEELMDFDLPALKQKYSKIAETDKALLQLRKDQLTKSRNR